MARFRTSMIRRQPKCYMPDWNRPTIDAFPSEIFAWSTLMANKTVLAIGIEPAFADFSAMPGLTAEMVRNYIDAQIAQLRALGFDAQSCLIDLGETAGAVTRAALESK